MAIVVMGPAMEPVCNVIILATWGLVCIPQLAKTLPRNVTVPVPAAEPAIVPAAASIQPLRLPVVFYRIAIT